MTDQATDRDRIVACHAAHPDWTARQIAEELNVKPGTVYNNARAAGITLAAAQPHGFTSAAATGPVAEEKLPVPFAQSRDAVDITVFATKPHEMAAAQQEMVDWAAARVAEAKADLDDVSAGLQIAVENAWQTGPLERAVDKAARTVTFYEKIHLALAAGYYIVPPFPIDIFTIRTDRRRPKEKRSTNYWDRHSQEARLLPAGAGRYVARDPVVFQTKFPAIGTGPNEGERTEHFAKEFREVGFPFGLAKPQVMEATAAAMALKVFDQLGALPAVAKSDPIICGQILKPDAHRTPVTFFVAWWLETKGL